MNKFLTTIEGGDALSIGVDRDCDPRLDELFDKATAGKFRVKICLKNFGFAEHQENGTCGYGTLKLILKEI